jgi:hypothetical protein
MLNIPMKRHTASQTALLNGAQEYLRGRWTLAFDEPIELSTSAWIGHIPFAFWLVENLRPKIFVELGVHTGVSYLAVCQAVDRLGMSTRCYGVDTWKGDIHAGKYEEEVFMALASKHDRYWRFSSLMRTTFDEACTHFGVGTVDLLHIDGCHAYEQVRHDFETWRPKLSDNSVVMLHDVNVHERDFGVWRLWEEVRRDYPAFMFPHSFGLGVLATGSKLPEPVQQLFSSANDRRWKACICKVFANAGERLDALKRERHGERRKLPAPLRWVARRLPRAAGFARKIMDRRTTKSAR